jgi:hypothetical protein
MNQIHEVERDLKQTAVLCRTGRSKLAQAKQELTSNALLILSKQRKLQIYKVSATLESENGGKD